MMLIGNQQVQALFGWGACPEIPIMDTSTGDMVGISEFGEVTLAT